MAVDLGLAMGTWDDAEALVGSEIAHLKGADSVCWPMIRHELETLEWDCPTLWDDEVAKQFGLPGIVAPFSMYMTFGMPPYWSPGDPPIRDCALAPFAFGVVPSPGSAMLAVGTEVEFFDFLELGDQLDSVWRLVALTRKRTSLGDGAFFDYEITYRKQSGSIVALEKTSVFRYEPEEKTS